MLAGEHDFKALANNRHLWIWGAPNSMALSPEVCPVRFLPVLERSVTFAFCGRKLFRDFIEGNDVDSLCFDNAKGCLGPIRHYAQVANFR